MIIKESVVINKQFDEKKPSFMMSKINLNQVQDEVGYLKLGFDDETEINYWSYSLDYLEKSSYVNWPNRYKFIDIEILVGPN